MDDYERMYKMMGLSMGELLFYAGIACIGFAVCFAIVSACIFRITGKKLNKKLDELYGEL